jgi:hypothetical protein
MLKYTMDGTRRGYHRNRYLGYWNDLLLFACLLAVILFKQS